MPRADVSVVDVLADLARVFRRLRARWYVFGAQALVLRGLPRSTADLDVTVLAIDLPSRRLADALVAGGFSLRLPSPDFVATTRVLPVVHAASQFPVDVVLGGPGLEERFADRAEMVRVGRVSVPVASATDLVLMKVLAGRAKDLEDAAALMRAFPSADRDAELDRAAAELCAALGEDEVTRNLEAARARARASARRVRRAVKKAPAGPRKSPQRR